MTFSTVTANHLVNCYCLYKEEQWLSAHGLLVAVRPRYGAPVVAAWLAGIIVNLLTVPGFYDVALRDFGLLLGALTLTRLAFAYDRSGRDAG